MSEFGVRCTMADGGDTVVTVDAEDVAAAVEKAREQQRLFYGLGDGAGQMIAARSPSTTIVAVHEGKPISEWLSGEQVDDDGDGAE